MDLLRFVVCGNVDDGKSTLIGRLLHDSKSILEDQWSELEKSSRDRGLDEVNLALLTDGLRAEREQGITIDVAYRYFSTNIRRFTIIDTPGHVEYTRNMITGASQADMGVLLVDVTKDVQEQTRRHLFVLNLVGIQNLVVCVNKMDLVEFKFDAFEQFCSELKALTDKLVVQWIPISALNGDNVVEHSKNMPWYKGASLLETLEKTSLLNQKKTRFHMFVQSVISGYAGKIASGQIYVGDEIEILPSREKAKVSEIRIGGVQLQSASEGQSVLIRLNKEIDIQRGNIFVAPGDPIQSRGNLKGTACVLSPQGLRQGQRILFQMGTLTVLALVEGLDSTVDVQTGTHIPSTGNSLEQNDLAAIRLQMSQEVFHSNYTEDRATGSALLIDEGTKETLAGFLIGDCPYLMAKPNAFGKNW